MLWHHSASDKEFRDAHPTPLAFTLIDGKGKMITYKTSDGIDACAMKLKPITPTNNWVIDIS